MSDARWTDEEEYFQFFLSTFDIREAKRILAKRKRVDVGQMSVAGAGGWIGEPPVAANDLSGIVVGGVTVDWEKAASDAVDTSVPVILAYTKSGAIFPIDGWHRIAKAKLQGLTHLPAVALTKAESRRVRS